jgi:integrase/recombinase XerD
MSDFPSGQTLQSQLEAYLAHLTVERGLSSNTLAAYRRDLSRYLTFLSAMGKASLGEAHKEDVSAFGRAIATGDDGGSALAPASAGRTIVAVRGWHRFAAGEGWTPIDASRDVKPPQIQKKLPKAIDVNQVFAILEAAKREGGSVGLRDHALLEFLYATGARISEAVGLDVDDLDLTAGEESARLRGKGGKERVVPIGTAASLSLGAYLVRARGALASLGTGTPALFLNSRGERLSRQSAWAILKVTAERAEVDGVSPHTLRHSFATHMLSGGADVRVVQELLGHASVTTTQIYTKVTQDTLREVYSTSHPRALG